MRWPVLLPVLLVLPLVGCGKEEAKAPPVVRPVLSTVITPLDLQTVQFVGSVEPRVRNVLGFQIFGRLISRNVDIGDLVKTGQRLAAIDTVALEQSIRSAEASLAGARAELTNATNTEERKRALLQTGASTQAELDTAVQALESAKSAVLRGQAELTKVRDQLGYAQLTASFDGVVTAVSVEVGQVVAAGQSVLTIARPDLRDAMLDLPEQTASLVQLGTPFDVSLQLDSTIKVRGAVREIAPLADATTRTRRIRVALDSPPDSFRLGSTIMATPVIQTRPRIVLPVSAILQRDGKSRVWIVDAAAKTVTTREVTVGAPAQGQVEILTGLSAGDRVVTAGVNSLTENQQIKIAGVQ